MAAFRGQECLGLLDIHTVKGCADTGTVIDQAAKLIQPVSSYVFKVVGENRLVAVVNSPDSALRMLNPSITGYLEVTCTPMYKYENFAKGVLEVDTSVYGDTPELQVTEKDFVFWLHATVNYTGKTTEELLALWKDEAMAALGSRQEGNFGLVVYKGVFQREVQAFFVMDSADQLDALSFTLPMLRKNGENIHATVKNVKVFGKQ